MVIVIDNYDSFVYNLARYIGQLGYPRVVFRNDKISVEEMARLQPTHVVLSPGPGAPDQAGILLDAVRYFSGKVPILGVCLGHQAIGQVFGGRVVAAKRPLHGKTSFITHTETGLFQAIKNPLKVTRYHSLVVDKETLPSVLESLADSEEQEIMALQHRVYPVFGVQFHPESILTECGSELIRNFLALATDTNQYKID